MMSALLDGELSPPAAAETAEALAADPVLAARFAALARLRAVTSALDAGLPAPSLPTMPTPAFRPRMAWAAAAAVCVVVGLGAALAWPSAQVPVVEAHRRFLAETVRPAVQGFTPPDLTAAGLRLVSVEPVGGGFHAGYVGPRGCRLGIWTGPSGALPATAPPGWQVQVLRHGQGEAVWIAADVSMERDRFLALGRAVNGEAGVETLLALGGAGTPPCRA
jgi:hypothetical protein